MGRCHEFGSQIREGCGHPMQAGETTCACPECGVVCEGLFDGCPDVWARGPRPVTLSLSTAAPLRTRALNAGPAAQQQAEQPAPPLPPPTQPSQSSPFQPAPPPPRQSPLANGFSGGPVPPPRQTRTSPPPPPPPPPPPQAPLPPPQPQIGAGSRSDLLHWFEDAFDDLRNELHAVVSTVTRQQAMLAELLDTRETEMRVVLVAESLPELAGEAAAKALADQTAGLAELVEASLEEFRVATESSELSAVATMDGMRELLQRIEVTAEVEIQVAGDEGLARLEALKASVTRQLKPVAAAVAAVAARVDEAQEREAARNRALRASLTKQVQPLTVALAAAIDRSDAQMAEIRARLDAIASPPPSARPARPAKVTTPTKVTGPAKAAKAPRAVKGAKVAKVAKVPNTDRRRPS